MPLHPKPACATGNDADRCTAYALVALFALIASLSTLVIDATSSDFGPPSPHISDSGADPNPSDWTPPTPADGKMRYGK